MTPKPFDGFESTGSKTQQTPTFNCPKCTGSLYRDERMLVCGSCRHVPKHGAD